MSGTTWSWRDLLALGLGAALLYGVALGARDLWNPNEPTYGRAVAEMARSGAWAVPTVNDLPFGEKPILYFWLARASALALGGVDERSLRAPAAAAGVALVVLCYLLVAPYRDARRARWAATMLATTYIVFWSARQIQMDLLVAATTLAAVVAITRVTDHGLRPALGWSLGGLAAGAGVLAKGPVGLVCPALVIVAYLAWTGRLRALRPAALGLVAAGVLVVAAPWFVGLWLAGETSLLHELLVRQNLLRFVEPWDHAEPWWYFLVNFWPDMAPWGLFLPLALGLRPDDERERRLHALAWLWIATIVVFFSLSASKRSPYILPVAPAVAILVSAVAERRAAGRLSPARARVAAVLLVGVAALLLGGAGWLARSAAERFGDTPALVRAARESVTAAALAAGAILAGLALGRRRRRAPAAALLGAVLLLYGLAATRVLPALDARKSHREFCRALNERVARDVPLRGYGLWRWRASYSFYSDRSVPGIDSPQELLRYWHAPGRACLLVERGKLEEVRRILGPLEAVLEGHVGSNAVYLFDSSAPPPPASSR